jgi:hypothetical protein
MIKKFLLILIVLAVIVAGLQTFGGRDFSQISTAWDKYTVEGEVGTFLKDIGTIFAGGKIKEGILPSAEYYGKVMYRWIDEEGITHISELKPDVDNFEVIKMGDLKYKIEEGLDKEKIKKTLKKDG